VNNRLQQRWKAGFGHRAAPDFESRRVQWLAVHTGPAATLLIVLGLLASGVVATFETAEKTTYRADAETLVQRAVRELGTIVEETVEIRAERDLLILDLVLRSERGGIGAEPNGSAHQTSNDTLAAQIAKAKLRRFICDPCPGHNARLAFGLEPSALYGLKAMTLVKAAQLIAMAEAEGIELRWIAGYGGRLHRPDVMKNPGTVRSFSIHNTGLAFDVAIVEDNELDYGPSAELSRVGVIGRALGLRWGGDFPRHKAWSHFEVPGARAR